MESIRQAVVVARGVTTLERVAGLPLIKRQILTLRRAGLTRVVVVAIDNVDAVRALIDGDAAFARAGVEVEVVAAGASASDGAALRAVRDRVDGPFVLVLGDRVFDPAIAKAAAASDLTAADVHDTGAGVLAAGATFCDTVGDGSIADAVRALVGKGRARTIDIGGAFSQVVDSPESADRARAQMFRALTKPTDGWASRHFNRPMSLRVTRLLLNTSITPNQMTVFAGIIGFFGIWLVGQATWTSVLVGGVLIHVQSVLDGCDGELARLKFQTSKVGEWLDNVIDDTMNILYGLAVGHAAAVLLDMPVFRWLGIATAACFVFYNAVVYAQLWLVHRSGNPFLFRWWFQKEDAYIQSSLASSSGAGKLAGVFHAMGRRDTFLLAFMILCIVRLPQAVTIWYFTIASTSALLAVVHIFAGGLARDLRTRPTVPPSLRK